MNELVLDASAAVRALTALDDHGLELQGQLSERVCIAPHLIDAEVGSVLRRHVAAGLVKPLAAEAALRALETLVAVR